MLKISLAFSVEDAVRSAERFAYCNRVFIACGGETLSDAARSAVSLAPVSVEQICFSADMPVALGEFISSMDTSFEQAVHVVFSKLSVVQAVRRLEWLSRREGALDVDVLGLTRDASPFYSVVCELSAKSMLAVLRELDAEWAGDMEPWRFSLRLSRAALRATLIEKHRALRCAFLGEISSGAMQPGVRIDVVVNGEPVRVSDGIAGVYQKGVS